MQETLSVKIRENSMVFLFIIMYTVSIAFGKTGQHFASGLLLLIGAIGMYIHYYLKSKCIVDFRALLSLFWIGGEGVAAFSLSKLQTEWSLITWFAFALFYFSFLLGYELLLKKWEIQKIDLKAEEVNDRCDPGTLRRLYYTIWTVVIVSTFCFLLEALILGYIPLFAKEPHAYNNFHISGVHYFTFSCMLTHPLTLIYVMLSKNVSKKNAITLVILNIVAISIAIMCISKFQFVLTLLLPATVYALMIKEIHWKRFIIGSLAIIVTATIIITCMVLSRNYMPGYLNDIFEMKNSNIPMFIQYPYMYIANNYANFNCLVTQMQSYTWGLRSLFPIFALTGLKFIFPQLISFPIYLTKPELNTLTILYDAYYDFGLFGVVLFGLILGAVCCKLTRFVRGQKNPIKYLFYGQIAMYIILSFFSTWFSNATTWFWLVITGMIYIYVGKHDIIWRRKWKKQSA
ncbi:MAG: O-antigen polymerase [Lachnospiraceae bacterium]